MARGWESKGVETQIEDAERGKAAPGGVYLSPEQAEICRKKEGILLSLARVRQDLETARNPRYQSILRQTLNHLQGQLTELEKGQGPPGT